MGAKNHQPCREFLGNSTSLSKYLSLFHARLELANVELEDVILNELQSKTDSVERILNNLNTSEGALIGMQDSLIALRTQMEEKKYTDLPPLQTLNLKAIGKNLSGKRVVNLDAWNKMYEMMIREGTFYAVLDFFEKGIADMKQKTIALMVDFTNLEEVTKKGELNLVLEANKPGNIKTQFAILYTILAEFEANFLASSLISTEVWYAYMGHTSLSSLPKEELFLKTVDVVEVPDDSNVLSETK